MSDQASSNSLPAAVVKVARAPISDAELRRLAAELGRKLVERGAMFASAESCTGGLIAARVTDIAGSSAWFDRAFVTYSNAAKQSMLGVPAELIMSHGAVSEPVVHAMCEGVLKHSQADLSVSVSGVAGPDGGSAEKPVGTVWISWQQRQQPAIASCYHFDGDRRAVRQLAVEYALTGALRCFTHSGLPAAH